jgi:hypothetical protein
MLFSFFTSMAANCKEPLIMEKNNNKLISQLLDTITPVLLKQGNMSYPMHHGYQEYRSRVVRTSTEWESLKTFLPAVTFNDQEIDFSTYQVIVVFAIDNSSTTIDITDIIEYPDNIVVHTSILGLGLTDDVVLFFHIVKIPVSKKEIIFKHDDRKE